MSGKKGKVIVIDGLDGTGKSTQAPIVQAILQERYGKVKLISFPDYANRSSELVKLYLEGGISSDPDKVNAYAASSFYAVDRYVSYKNYWEELYNDGYIIVATRYTTSNALHQMVKLPHNEWDSYLEWLKDYEYNKLGLPVPDCVILLTMERQLSNDLIDKRNNKANLKKDIHELDTDYLQRCNSSAIYAADKLGFSVINCSGNSDGDKPRLLPIEEITNLIVKEIDTLINIKI